MIIKRDLNESNAIPAAIFLLRALWQRLPAEQLHASRSAYHAPHVEPRGSGRWCWPVRRANLLDTSICHVVLLFSHRCVTFDQHSLLISSMTLTVRLHRRTSCRDHHQIDHIGEQKPSTEWSPRSKRMLHAVKGTCSVSQNPWICWVFLICYGHDPLWCCVYLSRNLTWSYEATPAHWTTFTLLNCQNHSNKSVIII